MRWFPRSSTRPCLTARHSTQFCAATRALSVGSSNRIRRSSTPTAIGCSALCTTRRTRSRTRSCAPGVGWPLPPLARRRGNSRSRRAVYRGVPGRRRRGHSLAPRRGRHVCDAGPTRAGVEVETPSRSRGSCPVGRRPRDAAEGKVLPIALDVLTVHDSLIIEVIAFRTPDVFPSFGLPLEL